MDNVNRINNQTTPRSLKVVIQLIVFFYIIAVFIAVVNLFMCVNRVNRIEIEVGTVK